MSEFWQRPQGVVAVFGGVISGVAALAGLVFLFFPDILPKPKPDPKPPKVQLAGFDLDREKEIAADQQPPEQPATRIGIRESMLSATLRNNGDNPVLITRAEVRFASARPVGCPVGAGDASIEARYDIKVSHEKTRNFTQNRKMAYTLPPHSQERIAFTVGPEVTGAAQPPMLYTFSITLHLDDGTSIRIPYVRHLAPQEGAEGYLANARSAMAGQLGVMRPECLRAEAAAVQRYTGAARHPSPELREFSREFTKVVGQQ